MHWRDARGEALLALRCAGLNYIFAFVVHGLVIIPVMRIMAAIYDCTYDINGELTNDATGNRVKCFKGNHMLLTFVCSVLWVPFFYSALRLVRVDCETTRLQDHVRRSFVALVALLGWSLVGWCCGCGCVCGCCHRLVLPSSMLSSLWWLCLLCGAPQAVSLVCGEYARACGAHAVVRASRAVGSAS